MPPRRWCPRGHGHPREAAQFFVDDAQNRAAELLHAIRHLPRAVTVRDTVMPWVGETIRDTAPETV